MDIYQQLDQYRQEAERLRAENQLLQTLIPAISQATNFDAALEITLTKVCEVTGWNLGEAWTIEPQGTHLVCSSAWFCQGVADADLPALDHFRQVSLALTLELGNGLPGRVWRSQQSEWLQNNELFSQRLFQRASLTSAIGIQAGLGIPILNQGQLLAVLVFFMFTACPEDHARVDLIQAVAIQLGAVLHHKQTEATLRQTEARYRSIFENALEGIFQTSPSGNYISANPALSKIYGYAGPEELTNKLADIERQLYVLPHRRQEFVDLMQRHDAVSHFESQVYRNDGKIIWISENARAVRDESGTLLYYEGTVEDITERKEAEEALRKSEAKNRALLNVIPDAMFRINRSGFYLDFKAASPPNFPLSVPPDAIVGRHLFEVLPREMAQQIQFYAAQALDTGTMPVFEYPMILEGQPHDYEVRVVVSGEDEVLAIQRDITERKKVERMKSEFVSMVSHELRTPLTSVRGALGLIAGGVVGEIPPQAKSLLDIAFKNSERLVLLINDILDIEKIESGKMDFHLKPLDLVGLVKQSLEANRSYGDQFGVTFELETQVSTARVNVDSDRLMQVLANLLSNAVKFSPPQGVVKVTIQERLGGWIRVAVCDRGPGIPADFQTRIFQKFAQADSSDTRQKGGTGLGLNISKAIIEKLHGHIGFTTAPNQGTTFYFDLPQLVSDSHSTPRTQPLTTPLSRVLICEDDPDIATLLSLMLKQGGFQTDIAHHADQAKAYLREQTYTAMTVDLALPGQDGLSLIRELREQEATRTLPIIVVSAKAQQGREALSSNSFAVIDWLDKPIDQNRLITAVSQAAWHRVTDQPHILHVENDLDVLQVVAVILQDIAHITQASNLHIAQEKLAQESFDLVILDLDLPDGSGLELLPSLCTPTGKPIPVVVFSAQETGMETIHQVAATLVKSRTSNQNLVDTIQSLIQGSPGPSP